MRVNRFVVLASMMGALTAACSTTIDLSIPSTTIAQTETTAVDDATTGATGTTPQDPESTTTTIAEPSYLFTLTPNEIFGVGDEPWEEAFVTARAITLHEGTWHMFYMGSRATQVLEDARTVGHATSDNGVDFFRTGVDPILDYSTVDYIDNFPIASSVLVDDDGTWMLFFSTSGFERRRSSGLIARATAPGPRGPWTFDDQPALVPGERSDWDDLTVSNPHVVKVGAEYRMYYDAHASDRDSKPNRHIGLATSTDAVTWTKYDDPATTEEPYGASDPVFKLDADTPDAWDSFRVYAPVVIADGDGYVMFYTADRRYENLLERTHEFGVATSDDGIAWTRHEANPVWSTLSTLDDAAWSGAFAATAVRSDATWTIYVTAGLGITRPGQVRALVYEGPLR